MGWFDKPEPEVPDDNIKVVISPYDFMYACRLYDDDEYHVGTKFARTRWGARRVARKMLRDHRSKLSVNDYREEIRV